MSVGQKDERGVSKTVPAGVPGRFHERFNLGIGEVLTAADVLVPRLPGNFDENERWGRDSTAAEWRMVTRLRVQDFDENGLSRESEPAG